MQLQIASDLHLEFSPSYELPDAGADILILAGDIGTGLDSIAAFKERARRQPIIYVVGNHECYNSHLSKTALALRTAASIAGIHLLDNDEVCLDSARFVGSTLWTDFALHNSPWSLISAHEHITGFRSIRYGSKGRFTLGQSVALNRIAVD